MREWSAKERCNEEPIKVRDAGLISELVSVLVETGVVEAPSAAHALD